MEDIFKSNTATSFEMLQLQKAETLNELHAQKKIMAESVKNLFAPVAPANNKGTAIMRAFNTGLAVFDGVMLGIKVMRKMKTSLRKKSSK